jgi:hypothetical protein
MAAPYATQRRLFVGSSRAPSSNHQAAAASATASAYGRASWAYRLATGSTANTSPATYAAGVPQQRRAMAATNAVAAVIASTEGSRSHHSASPSNVQACMPR